MPHCGNTSMNRLRRQWGYII